MTVYDVITSQIIKRLEAGTIPWHKPWVGSEAPKNLVSKKEYRGINALLLMSAGFSSPYFLTYKQAEQLGGQVRKGEHGSAVVFWKFYDKAEETQTNGETVVSSRPPTVRYYTVFNVTQCDGLVVPEPAKPVTPFQASEACEVIASGYAGPKISHGGNRAYYRPSTDELQMPVRESFDTPANYYATLFHEMVHSTGHSSRLNRETVTDAITFGSTNYSKEELVAEIGAAFLCGIAGIETLVFDNSVAYIQGWLKKLNSDSKFIISAASQAQKAADFVQKSRNAE